MADQKQDNGPYTLHGRRTEHEQEVLAGRSDSLDKARAEADDMVDSGVWHHVAVWDRESRTVYTPRRESQEDRGNRPDDLPPAA